MGEFKQQDKDLIFALDIGTRSIVGVVGRLMGERFKVLAIETAEHGKRVMLDGQIDNIDEVAALATLVTNRLENKLETCLERVCVAAAGRALRTHNGSFTMELPDEEQIEAGLISQLEAGAVTAAEEQLQEGVEERQRFFLVGYTVAQYYLDNYPMTTLLHHSGKTVGVDVVATFLPGEVVESLYTAMRTAGLQVSCMTLEPIAAMNAAIPEDIRLLNLALVDIGAGTTDIALCRDGSVVGYTMATLAGDEITEAVMRSCLVDFQTAESIKRNLDGTSEIRYTNILGLEDSISAEEMEATLREPMDRLADAIAQQVVSVNGGAPSALFLSGGGSKLYGLRERVAQKLGIDEKRVAVAGNNYVKSTFSDEYELNTPEYATPLGIAISAGMGLLNDSYVVMLNDQPAKLFRSGMLTLRDILLMNGYVYTDIIGRSGKGLSVTLDGKRAIFRGEPPVPAILRLNDQETSINTVVHAGDRIDFIPAKNGANVEKTLGELLGEDFYGRALVNNEEVPLDTPLKQGDVILTLETHHPDSAEQEPSAPVIEQHPIQVILNEGPLSLPGKTNGQPYYLMDVLEYSGIDFQNLNRPVRMEVNGEEAGFQRVLLNGDIVRIFCV